MKINKTFKNCKMRLAVTVHIDAYSFLPESTINFVDNEGNRTASVNVSVIGTITEIIKFKLLA